MVLSALCACTGGATQERVAAPAHCPKGSDEAARLVREANDAADPEAAIALYDRALALGPIGPRALLHLAQLLRDRNELARAAEHLEQATELAPGDADAWLELGDVRLRLGDDAAAVAAFTAAVRAAPGDPLAYAQLGDLLWTLDLPDEADAVLGEAIGHVADPTERGLYNVHVIRAGIRRDRNDSNGVIAELEAARAIWPSDPNALFNLGMAYAIARPPHKSEAVRNLRDFVAAACAGEEASAMLAECEQAQRMLQRLGGSEP
jgi:tetratricopeptide (TPR) repeat protein